MAIGMINKLILAFVILIVGVVLISPLASSVWDITSKTSTTDTIDVSSARLPGNNIDNTVTFTVSNPPISDECPLTDYSISNSSTTFIETTDYVFTASDGTFILENSTNWIDNPENATLVTYVYCSDGYIYSGWGNTILNLVPGFFALAILLVSVALFYSISREIGIL